MRKLLIVLLAGVFSLPMIAQALELETGGGVTATVNDDFSTSLDGDRLSITSLRFGDTTQLGLRVAITDAHQAVYGITGNFRHHFRNVLGVTPYAEAGAGLQNTGFTNTGIKRLLAGAVGARLQQWGVGLFVDARFNTVFEKDFSDRLNSVQFTTGLSVSR